MIGLTAFEIIYTIIMIPNLNKWYVAQNQSYWNKYMPPPQGTDDEPVDWNDTGYLEHVN